LLDTMSPCVKIFYLWLKACQL